jgi:hypothetical protein
MQVSGPLGPMTCGQTRCYIAAVRGIYEWSVGDAEAKQVEPVEKSGQVILWLNSQVADRQLPVRGVSMKALFRLTGNPTASTVERSFEPNETVLSLRVVKGAFELVTSQGIYASALEPVDFRLQRRLPTTQVFQTYRPGEQVASWPESNTWLWIPSTADTPPLQTSDFRNSRSSR